MVWIYDEAFWLQRPLFSDEFVEGKALEGLEPSRDVASVDEVLEMFSQAVEAFGVEALDGRVLDNAAVHPLDLPIRLRMIDFCKPVFDAVLAAPPVEHVGHGPGSWSVGAAWRRAELDAVVGEVGVDFIGHGFDQGGEEGGGGCAESLPSAVGASARSM